MTWNDAKASLFLISDERVGRRVRGAAVAEDVAFEKAKAALGRVR